MKINAKKGLSEPRKVAIIDIEDYEEYLYVVCDG